MERISLPSNSVNTKRPFGAQLSADGSLSAEIFRATFPPYCTLSEPRVLSEHGATIGAIDIATV